jgi:nucleoside-diphosphate-sugar epimerase
MRCLVTGAGGFIGSSLCDALLDEGHEVIGVDCFLDYYPRHIKERNLSVAREFDRFTFTEADLVHADLPVLLQGAEVVFHLAAQPGVRASWGNTFDRYSDNNVLATQRLLEACRATLPRRLVYASSSSVYGNPDRLPVKESDETHPVSPYGVTKLAGEHLCRLYYANYQVPAVCLRYFTVYGPRQRPDMAFHRFIRSGLRRQPIEVFGDGNQTRDFTYIADVVQVTRDAAESGVPGAVYNVGGGARWALRDILGAIERVLDTSLEIENRPAAAGDVRDTYADTTDARRDLQFAPKTAVEQGLRNEASWLISAMESEPGGDPL